MCDILVFEVEASLYFDSYYYFFDSEVGVKKSLF